MRIINWFEIPVTDMARAKAFYQAVFQVELKDEDCSTTGGKMSLFPYSDEHTGGALCQMEHMVPSATGSLLYLNAGDDLLPYLARVEKAGGSVIMPRLLLSEEIGAIAVMRDSEGNHIGLHSTR